MHKMGQHVQRRNPALAVLLGMLSLAATTNATTYMVDQRHSAAADTNPGTLREAPLKTISAAAARAVAGDEVLVRPGVYRESVTLTNCGGLGAAALPFGRPGTARLL